MAEFKLIDMCRLTDFSDPSVADVEEGHVRINGDFANISAWEYVEDRVTTSDGQDHGVELRPTGRTIQLMRLSGIEVREGKAGELVIQGFRSNTDEKPISLRVKPDLNRCSSC